MGLYNTLEGLYVIHLSDGGQLCIPHRPDGNVKLRYEDWLEAMARKRTMALARSFNPADVRKWMQSTSEMSASLRLSWGAEGMVDSLATLPGLTKFFHLMVQASGRHPGIQEEQILKILLDPTPIGNPDVEAELADSTEGEESAEVYTNMSVFRDVLQEMLNDRVNFLRPPERGVQV